MVEGVWNAPSPALNLLVQQHPLERSGMREGSVLAQRSWAKCKQNQHRQWRNESSGKRSRAEIWLALW